MKVSCSCTWSHRSGGIDEAGSQLPLHLECRLPVIARRCRRVCAWLSRARHSRCKHRARTQPASRGTSMHNLRRGSDLILSLTPCCATAFFLVVSRLHDSDQGDEIGYQGAPIDALRSKNNAYIEIAGSLSTQHAQQQFKTQGKLQVHAITYRSLLATTQHRSSWNTITRLRPHRRARTCNGTARQLPQRRIHDPACG